MLAERKIGALIAVEREIGTRAIAGDRRAARQPGHARSCWRASSIPHTPLHDGGRASSAGNRIVAAGCVFPLSPREELQQVARARGTAPPSGLTEETDAIVVVVSEETGTISVAYRGRLRRGLDEERLRRMLSAVLLKGPRAKTAGGAPGEQLDLTPGGRGQDGRRREGGVRRMGEQSIQVAAVAAEQQGARRPRPVLLALVAW